MKTRYAFNTKRICPEKATVFYGENHSHSNRSEIANQLSFNLQAEPQITCEPVPHDLRLGSERYGFRVEQDCKKWVSPVQLRPIETWFLGLSVEEGIEIDRLDAILETMIEGGTL